MNFKDIEAPLTTETQNREEIENKTGNLYEAICIMGKRSEQINSQMKAELTQKLKDFELKNEGLEEVFENREQIEVSKFYEKLPKPTSIALKEWLEDDIYYRKVEEESQK